MELIGKNVLAAFLRKHSDASTWIGKWIATVEGALWLSPQGIKESFASASFLENNLVIFNVKGNTYRLEVQVAYRSQKVNILWIGTHAEYDKRNKAR